MEKLINWSELSRYITKGDRNSIRFKKIPKKHINALDKLFNYELQEWWLMQKTKLGDSPKAGKQNLLKTKPK